VAGAVGQARDAVSQAGAIASGGGLPGIDADLPQVPGLGMPTMPNWPGAGMPGADLGTAAAGAVSGAASAAMGAAGSVVDAAVGTASHAVGGDHTPGGAPPPSTVDIDRLADLLEQRLLRQIERRGGRYAGVF